MNQAARKPQSKQGWPSYAAASLIAVLLVAADQIQDQDFAPDYLKSWREFSADEKAEIVAYFKERTDEELEQILNEILTDEHFRSASGYELALLEIVRRGGPRWEAFLEQRLDALENRRFKSLDDIYHNDDERATGIMANLEMVTALRRVQKQPDPLKIFIEGPEKLVGVGAALPILKVKITNVDVEKARVGFREGGNYRSGRQTRWRIHVQDKEGNVIPVREHLGGSLIVLAGGISTEGLLAHEQFWDTTLDARSFIEVPPPGEYKLTILYHDTQTIAREPHLDGMIVFKSDPVPILFKPLTIAHGEKDRDAVRELVADLDGNQKLKIVAGTYGEWAHEFVSPASAQGKLLGMGLPAVPTLIESLHDEDLNEEKRAWLFGILFSLTSENDPRLSSAIGGYESLESGWQILGGQESGSLIGGLASSSQASVSGGEIKSESQDRLIERWDEWLRNVEVTDRAD